MRQRRGVPLLIRTLLIGTLLIGTLLIGTGLIGTLLIGTGRPRLTRPTAGCCRRGGGCC